nr:hypothetical protein [Mucilaginibacter sp. FT3.2]
MAKYLIYVNLKSFFGAKKALNENKISTIKLNRQ